MGRARKKTKVVTRFRNYSAVPIKKKSGTHTHAITHKSFFPGRIPIFWVGGQCTTETQRIKRLHRGKNLLFCEGKKEGSRQNDFLRKIRYERQKACNLLYNGLALEEGYRIDLLLEDEVVLEIKSINEIAAIHEAQILTYLRLLNLKSRASRPRTFFFALAKKKFFPLCNLFILWVSVVHCRGKDLWVIACVCVPDPLLKSE